MHTIVFTRVWQLAETFSGASLQYKRCMPEHIFVTKTNGYYIAFAWTFKIRLRRTTLYERMLRLFSCCFCWFFPGDVDLLNAAHINLHHIDDIVLLHQKLDFEPFFLNTYIWYNMYIKEVKRKPAICWWFSKKLKKWSKQI